MSESFLTENQIEQCEVFLQDTVNKTDSLFGLLSNSAGFIVAHAMRSQSPRSLELNDFSILAAANLSAISEMAKIVGETKGFTSMLLEGDEICHYMTSINNFYILQFLFPSNVKAGKVRFYAAQIQKSLLDILSINSISEDLSQIFDDDYFSLLDKQIEKTLASMSKGNQDNI